MQEKLDQLESLLKQVFSSIELHMTWKGKSTSEIENFVNEVFALNEDHTSNFAEKREQVLQKLLCIKQNVSLTQTEVPRLKKVLNAAIEKLTSLNESASPEETRFGSRLRGTNKEFQKLIQQNIISPTTPIYALHNSIRYEGSLSVHGYFNLFVEDSVKQFTSFSTAASFVCNKPIQKGWEFWCSLDPNEKEKSMQHFRSQIKREN